MIYVALFFAFFALGSWGCRSRFAIVRVPSVLIFFAGSMVSMLMAFKTLILGI